MSNHSRERWRRSNCATTLDASKLGFTLIHEHIGVNSLELFGGRANCVAQAVDKRGPSAIPEGDQNSEAVFVPRPHATSEDDGWVLACVGFRPVFMEHGCLKRLMPLVTIAAAPGTVARYIYIGRLHLLEPASL